jgi:NADPH-dependent 2,4-dienoyl-CoA reductase/sulfur reductase-like enzyme
VVVVGGGPAGLAAASVTATQGMRTVLIDEGDQLGGQYFKQRPLGLAHLATHRPDGARRIRVARDAGVEVLASTVVWGTTDEGELLVAPRRGGQARVVTGRSVVCATGAHEMLLPFPGWDGPGVITPGFALHLATVEGVSLTGRVLLAGSGPFLLLVAAELLRAGVDVVGVAEASPFPWRTGGPAAGLRHPRRAAQLAAMISSLARHRVPWWTATRLVAVEHRTDAASSGPDQDTTGMTAVLESAGGRRRSVPAGTVACAWGFRPNTELVRSLGCECVPDPVSGVPVPVVDAVGRTSRPGIYAIGDGASIGGADLATTAGRMAGAAIAETAGHPLPARTVAHLRRRARYERDFATRNGALWPAPVADVVRSVPDGITVCRCEAVDAGTIRTSARSAWHDLSGLKGDTRAGMGPCQGRECATAVTALQQAVSGQQPAPWTVRMPLRPVTIATVTSLGEVFTPSVPPVPDVTEAPGLSERGTVGS